MSPRTGIGAYSVWEESRFLVSKPGDDVPPYGGERRLTRSIWPFWLKPSQSSLRPLNIEGVSAVPKVGLVLACLFAIVLSACGGSKGDGGQSQTATPLATASGSGTETQSEGIKLE